MFESGFFQRMVTDIPDDMLRNVFRAFQLLQEVDPNVPEVGQDNTRIFYPNEAGLPAVRFVIQASNCFLVIELV
jgi:hypothetical protein